MPKPIPEGYTTITPYLIVSDSAKAIEYYERVFGAKRLHCMTGTDGTIRHAELQLGTSKLMLGQHADTDPRSKDALPRVSLYVFVPDVDRTFEAAVTAGGRVVAPVSDKFYGNREGGVEDPYGIVWWIASVKEELTQEQVEQRAREEEKKAQQAV